MFDLFKIKRTFDDTQKSQFISVISDMLEAQKIVAGDHSIEDKEGYLNRKAIGYIYGFIDAALRVIGKDMSDVSIGVPITYHVLVKLFPDRANVYAQFLIDQMGRDEETTLGAVIGGQQFLEFNKPGSKGVPMGFARFLIEGTKH